MPLINENLAIIPLVLFIVLFFAVLLVFGMISFWTAFSRELRQLNSEIRRTTGSERRYWIRRRRRLWLSLLPFVKY